MQDAEGKLTPQELRDRWDNPIGEKFKNLIINELMTGNIPQWNFLDIDNKGGKISFHDFKGVNEIDWKETKADLRGINLSQEDIKEAYLCDAHLEYANLYKTHLEHAKLRGAHLEYSSLVETHFEHANLSDACFHKADLKDAHFIFKSWWWRIKNLFTTLDDTSPNRPTILSGTELKNVKLDSDPILYRDLLDEQYLDSFAEKHKFLYPFWLFTSNCGRSVTLLLIWSIFFGVIFGIIFSDISAPSWLPFKDFFASIDPQFSYQGQPEIRLWQPIYLSFVTMTTLGLASAEPANTAGFWWHTIQNLFGYIWLGYLVAVLGSKLTRRSA